MFEDPKKGLLCVRGGPTCVCARMCVCLKGAALARTSSCVFLCVRPAPLLLSYRGALCQCARGALDPAFCLLLLLRVLSIRGWGAASLHSLWLAVSLLAELASMSQLSRAAGCVRGQKGPSRARQASCSPWLAMATRARGSPPRGIHEAHCFAGYQTLTVEFLPSMSDSQQSSSAEQLSLTNEA